MRVALYLSSEKGKPVDPSIVDLVAKTCPVKEVHFPQRPPQHFFLIVVVACAVEEAKAFVRNFNHTFWKGRKIRVELAKDFYRDRLEREWSDDSPVSPPSPGEYLASLPLFDAPVLRIRKRKGAPPIEIVVNNSTEPRGEKTPSLQPVNTQHIVFDSDKEIDDSFIESLQQERMESVPSHRQIPINKAEIETEPSISSSGGGLEGGGKRRGFGSLLKESPMDLEATLQRKRQWTYDLDLTQSLDGPDGAIPCVANEEVDEDVLRQERQRALSILTFLRKDSDRDEEEELPVVDLENSSAEVISDAVQSANGKADLGRLKSMFHREGGVWFGDDGTLEETVVKGPVDNIFLEAERLGIDIRKDEHSEDNKMTFSFFGNPAENSPMDTASQNNETLVPERGQSADSTAVLNTAVIDVASELPPVPTLFEVVELAKLFRPNKSYAEIERDWRQNRERLSMEYKRKRKEVFLIILKTF